MSAMRALSRLKSKGVLAYFLSLALSISLLIPIEANALSFNSALQDSGATFTQVKTELLHSIQRLPKILSREKLSRSGGSPITISRQKREMLFSTQSISGQEISNLKFQSALRLAGRPIPTIGFWDLRVLVTTSMTFQELLIPISGTHLP